MQLKAKHLLFALLASISLFSCKNDDLDTTPTQLTNEVYAIDKYLSTNKTDYILYYESGIRIAVVEFGRGVPPHKGQTVNVNFKERLFSDHTTLTDSAAYNDLLDNLTTSGLITGISLLPEGTKAKIYVPSTYAYGTKGTTKVPANSIVEYEVTLTAVTKTEAELTQFKADTAAIHQYLISKNITNANSDPSGIWYTLDTSGSGAIPTTFDKINASYQGSLMSSGVVFENGELTNQKIYNLIVGLRVGLPLIFSESTATFYVPSGLAYGTTGNSGAIPGNANLILKIRLKSVVQQ